MQVRVSVAAAMWCVAAFVPTLNAQGDPVGAYQLRYAANLPLSGSVVNLTNSGASSTSPGLVGGLPQNGNLCANIYTYSPDEQLVSCCTCLLTPNALAVLSVREDLAGNTLTPSIPSAVVVKLLASTGLAGTCSAPTVTRTGDNRLAPGLLAWGTTIHLLPNTAATAPGTYGAAETAFSIGTLSDAELTRMTQLCAFIRANGSGYGICKSCRFGGLGAASK